MGKLMSSLLLTGAAILLAIGIAAAAYFWVATWAISQIANNSTDD